jgi:topoisomerase-4 subunit B
MSNYTSKQIKALKGLEAVQKRPGMYTDTSRPNHLAQEVIDNSVDEAMSNFATTIKIDIFKNGAIKVEDDGRGMPTDMHEEEGKTGVEVILEELHSGGKFEEGSYDFSGGLHGVGISVVNALSSLLDVTIFRDGAEHNIVYNDSIKQSTLRKVGKCPKEKHGTIVYFQPNPIYFDSSDFHLPSLLKLIKGKAILCKGLKIEIYNEFTDESTTFDFEDGINEYVKTQDNFIDAIGDVNFLGELNTKENQVQWSCYWTEESFDIQESYVNLIPTVRGGTHTNALRQGLLIGFKEYFENHNLLPKNIKLSAEDVWKNINFVFSFKMKNPRFDGQTKERLSSRDCIPFISTTVKDSLSTYLNNNSEAVKELVGYVLANAQKRIRSASKVERKKLGKSIALPGKLTDCRTNIREEAELFVVEGDSAGGSAKQARDKENQAVLPLRGKILNTWEVDSHKILSSEEVNNIASAIGVDPNSDDLSSLRYGKICILADADSDGLHIAVLFIALFIKHFKPVVDAGHLFVAMPPLYRIDVGKKVFYALEDAEKHEILAEIESKKMKGEVNVQRFKGLGEMNPSQLFETTLDPVSRKLVRLEIQDDDEVDNVLDLLLSKKRASGRREWLENYGSKSDLAELNDEK